VAVQKYRIQVPREFTKDHVYLWQILPLTLALIQVAREARRSLCRRLVGIEGDIVLEPDAEARESVLRRLLSFENSAPLPAAKAN